MSQAQRVNKSNLSEIEKNSIDFVESKGIDYALLATTDTMKNKKIIDATKVISDYFERIGFHDYENQLFGSKINRQVFFRSENASAKSSGSFYRAGTRGDKRLNLSGFWNYSDGNEVNMLIVNNDILNIINVSKNDLKTIWESDVKSHLKEFFNIIVNPKSSLLFDKFEIEDIKNLDRYVIEGIVSELKVFARTRNKKIANERKRLDQFKCQACNFHYKDKIVECHHLNPLSMTNETIVSLDGLITLCPTCHAIAHQLLREDLMTNANVENLLCNLTGVLINKKSPML
ncbi:hypothetical protein RJP56_11355 [Shewanella baltica]|uniref:hypothetical protein n=1 Tax=Shewanella baltica TaxID=62322 RepID=UPI0028715AD8|nr:hypothetical protein [Shewanella baltica]MDR9766651.1 hypothetical protein [Shewanella baltica]